MKLSSSIDCLAKSLYRALHFDLSDINYLNRDFEKYHLLSKEEKDNCIKNNCYPMIKQVRRPEEYDVEIFAMFPQTWGSTALGFGGIGGAAITKAYTVVVYCSLSNEFSVYWNGEFAYKILGNNEKHKKLFLEYISNRFTPSIADFKSKFN